MRQGIQSQVGTLVTLKAVDVTSSYPLRDKARELLNLPPLVHISTQRIILVTDSSTIHLLGQKSPGVFAGQKVVATGQYNNCNQELTPISNGIELYQ